MGKTKSSVPSAKARADLRGLLALERRVDGQLALALQRDALPVEPPGQDHPAQQLAELLRLQADVGVADRGAVGRDEAERLGPAPLGSFVARFSSNAGDAESIGDAARR